MTQTVPEQISRYYESFEDQKLIRTCAILKTNSPTNGTKVSKSSAGPTIFGFGAVKDQIKRLLYAGREGELG